MKYAIKNCPCYDCGYCTSRLVKERGCINCTDCVMKQIVELCKENLNSLEAYVDVRSLECTMIQGILNLLDI